MTNEEPMLVDSNVLIYLVDHSDATKHAAARRLLEEIIRHPQNYVVATQNLREFASVALKKMGLDYAELLEACDTFTRSFGRILSDTVQDAVEAFALAKRTNSSYWDALLASTMTRNDVHTILTEDEKDFKKFPGLEVINPFR